MKNLKLIFSILLLTTSMQVTATTYDWVGGTGFWDDPNNWNPVGIPTASDEVTIFNGHSKIKNGYQAEADRIEIWLGGTLTVRKTGSLHLYGTVYCSIILEGVLNIYGAVNCTPLGGMSQAGIYNLEHGVLDVKESGTLYIDAFQFEGILTAGTFENHGNIHINGGLSGSIGIKTYGDLESITNFETGIIRINDISDIGFRLNHNTYSVPFQNFGVLKIKSEISLAGIEILTCDFKNFNFISVTGAFVYRIFINTFSQLYNTGTIETYASIEQVGDGIVCFGELLNTSNATLIIKDAANIGLLNTGEIENNGYLKINGTFGSHLIQNTNQLINNGDAIIIGVNTAGTSQLNNELVIENTECGYLRHSGPFHNATVNSTVYNDGYWISSCTSSNLQLGNFENIGVLADQFDSFYGLTYYNSGIIIPQQIGLNCINSSVTPILDIGANPQHTTGLVYTDNNSNTIGGIYSPLPFDILTLNQPSAGLNTLFLEFTANGCTRRMPIEFEHSIEGGIELCGDGIDNDCDGQIDEAGCLAPIYPNQEVAILEEREAVADNSYALEFQLFPNPSSGALNIRLSEDQAISNIRIHALTGQVIWEGISPSTLPNIPNGIYWIQVQTRETTLPVQKWIKQ